MKITHLRGSYEVAAGNLDDFISELQDAYLVTDETVERLWARDVACPKFVVKPGEESKSITVYGEILRFLATQGARRGSTVVALGGGVVGDLAGFVAATYMRGVRLVQVPTTLLSMVDSSVGGKVGINLPEGKNLVGSFYPPARVVLCIETLGTLSEREFRNGAAEIWKAGAALDVSLFERLEGSPLSADDDRLVEIVMHCVDLKRSVVEKDEFELSGHRAVLNFGHTVGHALEQALGYGTCPHGEAVAIGMVVEAKVGERLGVTPPGASMRIARGLMSQGLPIQCPPLDKEELLRTMRIDKKTSSGTGLSMALLNGLGSCKLVHGVPESIVLECLLEEL